MVRRRGQMESARAGAVDVESVCETLRTDVPEQRTLLVRLGLPVDCLEIRELRYPR